MKIYISYFYQIRFFTPNMIPLSTCCSDPAWFHNFTRDKSYKFQDKRGVWNGLRAEPFMPGFLCDGLCTGLQNCETKDPSECDFLKAYRMQLNMLDFEEIMRRFERLGKAVQKRSGFFEEPIPVLIVYETPQNPCSERRVMIDWFASHEYELEEWNKNI